MLHRIGKAVSGATGDEYYIWTCFMMTSMWYTVRTSIQKYRQIWLTTTIRKLFLRVLESLIGTNQSLWRGEKDVRTVQCGNVKCMQTNFQPTSLKDSKKKPTGLVIANWDVARSSNNCTTVHTRTRVATSCNIQENEENLRGRIKLFSWDMTIRQT